MNVHHYILHRPGVAPPPLTPAFAALLENCRLWWASKGVEMDFATPIVREQSAINLALDNPWPQTVGWWQGQPEYDPAANVVVLLSGWDHHYWIGFGGRLGTGGVSVMGDYAIERLLSVPTTPDDATDAADGQAIVDDWAARRLWQHEAGHAFFGLTHDFETPNALMGYDWGQPDAILGDKSAAELAMVQEEAFMLIQGCRRP